MDDHDLNNPNPEDHTPASGSYGAETGRRFGKGADLEQRIPAAMEGHRERAEAHAAMVRARQAAAISTGVLNRALQDRRQRRGKPIRMTRDLTAAQLHKRALAAADLDLGKRIQESGLWAGVPLSRRSWCSRLRELELRPERLEQIRDRITPAQIAQRNVAAYDEVAAGV